MMLDADRILTGLTEFQRQGVAHVEGPLLVLAGPGSGKTTVVSRRVAHLIQQGIPPWQILALTFTNKAAGEMRQRIEQRLDEDLPGRRGLTVTTFHSFCARLLRRYAAPAGIEPRFSIYDSADQKSAVKQAIKAAELNERNFSPSAVLSAISNAKNRLQDAKAFREEAGDFYHRAIARAYAAYEKVLRSNNALDFDDLLLVMAKLLRRDPGVRSELQSRYQYLLIDEYQDTNHAQFVIAHALAAEHRNICVVGDPDQSIYGWRGANIRNILEFEQQYPEAVVVPLGQNFRSTAHIVRAADCLIRHNSERKHKELYTELGEGEKPTVVVCRDEHHEAALIVDEFRRRRDEGLPWKEMAILYRLNALSRVLEDAFRSAQIPYVIARGTAFYERKEIKDALSYLRLIVNPNDEVALRRIVNTPTRGIGRTTLERIEVFALNEQISFFDALQRVAEVDGITPRAQKAIGKFVGMIRGWRGESREQRLRLVDRRGADPGRRVGPEDRAEAPTRLEVEGSDTEPALADGGGEEEGAGSGGDLSALQQQLAAVVDRVIREAGIHAMYAKSRTEEDMQRVKNLDELISAASQFEPAVDELADAERVRRPRTVVEMLAAFLESIALVSDADAIDPANGAVTLMTLHAAKGLEFSVVAIAGLEDGLLPHRRASESESELEEERRLCFVGITRAKHHLLMTRAKWRTQRGLRERTVESMFLAELPPDSVAFSDQGDEWVQGDTYADRWGDMEGSQWETAFPAGCLVRHPQFGVGRVETITTRAIGASARVTFERIGAKTLMLEYARLERVE